VSRTVGRRIEPGRSERAYATAPPAGSSLCRRPPVREVGQAPGVKVERPAGRTTFAPGAWSAWLRLGVGRGDDPASTSTTGNRAPRAAQGHPRAGAPAGGMIYRTRDLVSGAACQSP
jgi:hypothetical protein